MAKKKNLYGSLRKYKLHLKERGDFHNPTEQDFETLAGEKGINFFRKGYPDYQILNDEGTNIVGFIEVKPTMKSKLQPSQERFRVFCESHGIPFMKWSSDMGQQSIVDFVEKCKKAC